MNSKERFNYGEIEMEYLSRRDLKLGEIIEKLGKIELIEVYMRRTL